jgi:hypothetical protein
MLRQALNEMEDAAEKLGQHLLTEKGKSQVRSNLTNLAKEIQTELNQLES